MLVLANPKQSHLSKLLINERGRILSGHGMRNMPIRTELVGEEGAVQ